MGPELIRTVVAAASSACAVSACAVELIVAGVKEVAGCRIVEEDFGRRHGGFTGGIGTSWLRSASSDDSDCQALPLALRCFLAAAAAAALSAGCPHRGAVWLFCRHLLH